MSGRRQPQYIAGSGKPASPANFLSRFWASQITAPDKREGNIAIAVSSAVFFGAIVLTRTFGDLIVPQFA